MKNYTVEQLQNDPAAYAEYRRQANGQGRAQGAVAASPAPTGTVTFEALTAALQRKTGMSAKDCAVLVQQERPDLYHAYRARANGETPQAPTAAPPTPNVAAMEANLTGIKTKLSAVQDQLKRLGKAPGAQPKPRRFGVMQFGGGLLRPMDQRSAANLARFGARCGELLTR